MRIAQIAPMAERVPPEKYGGVERVVHEITEGLMKRGHEVTLFASGDSLTSAKLKSVYPRSIRAAKIKDIYGGNAISMLNIGTAYEMQDEFDIIHDHAGLLALPTANIAKTPVVITYHGAFDPQVRRLFQKLKKPHLVSISKAQVHGIGGLNLAGNVYNGLSMEKYPFSETHDGYLLYVGRISLEKGVHYAIEAAIYLNMPLIIAAKLEDVDMTYFKEYIKPRLTENIRWVGEVTEEERNRLMSRALCFLHPVIWKEPFGLTLIEAMACGCPVVAFAFGSIPEIIVQGKTGYIVSDMYDMIEAVKSIQKISRKECRRHVLKNFNAELMVGGYEKVFHNILKEKKK